MATDTLATAPALTIPALRGGKRTQKIRLFPAERWGEQGGEYGEFRVMAGDAWIMRPGEKYSFFDLAAVGRMVTEGMAEALGLPAPPLDVPGPPGMTPGMRAWVHDDADPFDCRERVITSWPYQNKQGEWCVVVKEIHWTSFRHVLCRNVTVKERTE